MTSKKRPVAGRVQGNLDGFLVKKVKPEQRGQAAQGDCDVVTSVEGSDAENVEVVAAPASVHVRDDGKDQESAEATRPGAGIGTGSATATTLASASAAAGAAVVAAALKKATAAAATTPATTPATTTATTTAAAAATAAAAPTPVPTPAPRAADEVASAAAAAPAQPVSQSAAQQARGQIVPPNKRGKASELRDNPGLRVLQGTLSAQAALSVLSFGPRQVKGHPSVELVSPGIVVLRRFMDDTKCVELLAAVDEVSRKLPFTIPEVKNPHTGAPAYSNLYMTFAGQVWK